MDMRPTTESFEPRNMATTATKSLQPTLPVESAGTPEVQGVSSRRLKKREIDRRCQRQARERTKTRIAYLEGLVEDFRRQDSSGQVATLMKQLRDVEGERDVMAKTLKDIQKAMDILKPSKAGQDDTSQNTTFDDLSQMVWADPDPEEQKPNINTMLDNGSLPVSDPQPPLAPANSYDLANFSPAAAGARLPAPDILFGPQVIRLDSDSPQSTTQALVQSKVITDPTLMPSFYAANWAQPLQGCSCQSSHDHPRVPGRKSIWRGNYWRYANEVLSECFDWPDHVEPTSDAAADDVPVRAVLEGWDAVAERGPMHPSWQILRRIDQTLFRKLPKTERLAILRSMHSLLQFHTESTSQRFSRLPPWYNKRPAQKIAHSYAIDFFCWPGVRERFIFSEHDYCTNEFWNLFSKSMRVLWPYEFRDCYTREKDTGLYKVSPHFDERLMDIRCWAMGPDMFQRFPELYSDIPSLDSIPPSLSLQRSSPSRLALPAPEPKKQKAAAPEEAKQTQAQRQPRLQQETQMRYTAMGFPMGAQQMTNISQVSNVYQYGMPDLNSMTALDAFAYGAISETDFAAMYHPEDLEGYPNITF